MKKLIHFILTQNVCSCTVVLIIRSSCVVNTNAIQQEVVAFCLGGSDSTVRSIASASASGCVNRICSSSSSEGLASFKKVGDTEGLASFTEIGDGDMLK